jgi:hypothetical protein
LEIPGVRVQKYDVLNDAGSEEIDVVCWNGGLRYLPQSLMFECKNWAAKVSSAEVAVFAAKLLLSDSRVGFLIAANGITGDAQDRTRAYGFIRFLAPSQNKNNRDDARGN